MQPVGVLEEGLKAVRGEDEVFVFDGLDYLLLGLLLQELLLAVSCGDQ